MAIQRLKILALCSWYPNDFNPTLGNFVKKHAEAASLYNDVVSLSVFPSLLDKKIRLVETRTRTFSEIVVYYPKTTSKFRLWNMFRNYFAHRHSAGSRCWRLQQLEAWQKAVHCIFQS